MANDWVPTNPTDAWEDERPLLFVITRECEACGASEERVFVDSYTGRELCPSCLSTILPRLTMSPASEGDNMVELLKREEII